MKVLILAGSEPRHKFFVEKITEIDKCDFFVLGHRRLQRGRMIKMLKKNPSTFLSRVSKYFYFGLLNIAKKEEDFFRPKIDSSIYTYVDSLNSSNSIKLIKEFSPDLIVSFGVPIISNKILKIPEFGAINLHGGISPDYKGGNTIFWPLLKKDFKKVGATIHYMVKKVDSGDILAKVYPELKPQYNEFIVSWKAFEMGTMEFVKIVEAVRDSKDKLTGKKQQSVGALYLAKYRTLTKSIIGHFKIKRNLRKINQPKNIERCYHI